MKDCPCGSGRPYSDCCEQYIKGRAKAPTAEALMRSRYSAYVEHEIDYIMNTCVRKSKDDAAYAPIDYKSTRDWSEQSSWLGLKIISVEKGGIADTEGTVEFEASYMRDGLKDIHHEKAKFKKEGSAETAQWLYDEGHVTPRTVVRAAPKTGRNDPCPCGSGKKYKHCCLNK
ncbi:MAG: YchJ family protein [Treponema sp.]|jgi:SEC-C motif-containing protein|nr:YchJ family protein [Treponema sp.]